MKFDILKPETVAGVGSSGKDGVCVFPTDETATIHDKLFILAEGNDASGTKAAEVFTQTFADQMFQNTCADEPLEENVFNEALFAAMDKMDEDSPDSKGIQYAMLYLHRHGVLAAHSGQVRIYHLRPKERRLLYKSKDNECALVPGKLPVGEPVKAYITNVKYGDYFVILSKSLCQVVSDRELMDVLCEPVNDRTKSVRLQKKASASDAGFAASVIHISGVMSEAMDESLFENEGKLMAAMLADIEKNRKLAADAKMDEKDKQDKLRPDTDKNPRKVEPETEEEYYPESTEEEPRKREFPIVTATALALVLLAIGIWFWAQQQKHDDSIVQEEVENKGKAKEKDTINILKNTQPKAVSVDDTKIKEEEEKKKEEKKEEKKENITINQEKMDEGTTVVSGESSTVTNTPATPAQDKTATSPQPATPSTATPPTTPATTQPSTNTPPPTNSPQSDGTVKPRPVIPEGE